MWLYVQHEERPSVLPVHSRRVPTALYEEGVLCAFCRVKRLGF